MNHTLDPTDWDAFRALGHRMLDDMLDHLAALHTKPAWQPMPDGVRSALASEPLPRSPQGDLRAVADFFANVLPYPNGNLHPRFWGWVQGNGTPLAMLADMLASGMNPHMAGFNQAPAIVEQRVIDWLSELMGFPPASSGVLVTGGTTANLVGLTVARHAKAGFNIRENGLQGGNQPELTMYCSTESHSCVQKAAELLGLGNRSLRRISVDDDFRMDLAALRAAVAADRAAGKRPICVAGTAGTINTGATDDLGAIADFCKEQDLWFHVDGAFGALARLSPKLAPFVEGIDRADSLAFDLHKWMYQPFEIACVLVRDAAAHRAAFALTPSYLAETTRGVIAGGLPFAERGIDLTRGFKALKAWMSIKAHGIDAFARLIEQNVEQVRYLAERIDAHPKLERLAPAPLNVICFRYVAPSVSTGHLDALNRELLVQLQESGVAVPSSTVIRGQFALRVAIVNHRTRNADLDTLLAAVLRIGDDLAAHSDAILAAARRGA